MAAIRSMIGFAARPGTGVLTMCSMRDQRAVVVGLGAPELDGDRAEGIGDDHVVGLLVGEPGCERRGPIGRSSCAAAVMVPILESHCAWIPSEMDGYFGFHDSSFLARAFDTRMETPPNSALP